MAQVTIYLEDTLADAMRTTVKANNISQSRWISHLIEQALQTEWPTDVAALAGAWRDFPTLDEIGVNYKSPENSRSGKISRI